MNTAYSISGEGLETIIVREKDNIKATLESIYEDHTVYVNFDNTGKNADIEMWSDLKNEELLEMAAVKCEVY